ncbi:unnamed protein product, partial [marine sediment metagenome]
MYILDWKESNHDWSKQNLVTISEKRGFGSHDIYK